MPEQYLYIPSLTARLPDLPADSILSQTIHSTDEVKVVLFGFAAGQSLSEHTASVPAILQVLQGKGTIELAGDLRDLEAGGWIYMPARLEHALHAEEEMKVLLYLLHSATIGSAG